MLTPASRSFGYAAALQAELTRIGPLSIEEFERRYAAPTTFQARLSWDPLVARYGETFRRDPAELLRQRVVEALDALLSKEPGPSVPEATLQSLFRLWDAFEATQETSDEWNRGRWGEAWEAVLAYTRANPLLTVVAEWDDWERQRLEALRGLRFETASDLLDWLEDTNSSASSNSTNNAPPVLREDRTGSAR